jgi:hypothetical protein
MAAAQAFSSFANAEGHQFPSTLASGGYKSPDFKKGEMGKAEAFLHSN